MHRGGREVEVGQSKERKGGKEGGREEVDGKKRDDIDLN